MKRKKKHIKDVSKAIEGVLNQRDASYVDPSINPLIVKQCSGKWVALTFPQVLTDVNWAHASDEVINVFTTILGGYTKRSAGIYLSQVLTYDIDEKEMEVTNSDLTEKSKDLYHERASNMFRRLIKQDKLRDFRVRLETPDSIIHMNAGGVIEGKDYTSCVLTYLEFNLKEDILIGKSIVVIVDEYGINHNNSWNTTYYNGLSHSKVKAYVNQEKSVPIQSQMLRTLKIVTFGIKRYLDTENFKEHDLVPVHKEFELRMISKSMRELLDHNDIMIILNSWVMNENTDIDEVYTSNYGTGCRNEVKNLIDNFLAMPIVDLNVKEFDFINNYLKDHHLDIAEKDKIDLVKFLTHSRYGNSLRWYKDTADGREDFVSVSYDFDMENDLITFYVGHFTEKNLLMGVVQFKNPAEFDLTNNVMSVTMILYYEISDKNILPNSMESVTMDHGIDVDSYVSILNSIWDTIKIHVIAYLRPERTKIVRLTERKAPAKKDPNKPHHESDIIITRILKTTYEAKKLAKKSAEAAASNEPILHEYTIESWNRVGHWRKTKNGAVWIEPTICHRNPDLLGTFKEVHIKL